MYDFTDNTLTISLSGEIDHHSAMAIREKADTEIEKRMPREVVMDLSGTSFMDSSGLGLILGRYRKCGALGIPVKLKNPDRQTYRLLVMAGVNKFVKIVFDKGESENVREAGKR